MAYDPRRRRQYDPTDPNDPLYRPGTIGRTPRRDVDPQGGLSTGTLGAAVSPTPTPARPAPAASTFARAMSPEESAARHSAMVMWSRQTGQPVTPAPFQASASVRRDDPAAFTGAPLPGQDANGHFRGATYIPRSSTDALIADQPANRLLASAQAANDPRQYGKISQQLVNPDGPAGYAPDAAGNVTAQYANGGTVTIPREPTRANGTFSGVPLPGETGIVANGRAVSRADLNAGSVAGGRPPVPAPFVRTPGADTRPVASAGEVDAALGRPGSNSLLGSLVAPPTAPDLNLPFSNYVQTPTRPAEPGGATVAGKNVGNAVKSTLSTLAGLPGQVGSAVLGFGNALVGSPVSDQAARDFGSRAGYGLPGVLYADAKAVGSSLPAAPANTAPNPSAVPPPAPGYLPSGGNVIGGYNMTAYQPAINAAADRSFANSTPPPVPGPDEELGPDGKIRKRAKLATN